MPLRSFLRALRRRLGGAARRDLDEELRFHLDMESEHNVSHLGYTPRTARAKARRELGSAGPDRAPAAPLGAPFGGVGGDVRLALRSLRRTPGFTAVALLTLAVGIGASTAVFSVVDGVLLRPLPFPEPHRLVRLHERTPRFDRSAWTGANARDVQTATRTLSGVAYARPGEITILGADEPRRARVTSASPNFFDVLRVRAERGRTFLPDEGREGSGHVGVVSRRFWETALGADPRVTERTLDVGGLPVRIVGVAPPSAILPSRTDLWVATVDDNPHRTAHNWTLVVGRLAPDATVDAARAEVDGLLRRLKTIHGKDMTADGALLDPLHADLGRSARTTLLVLLGAVALVVLIGCVNLASAALARGESRRAEFAVRTALGAGQARIVRQVLVENLVLGALGGALGVGLAWTLTRLLAGFAAPALPGFAAIRVDARVLAFAVGASLLSGALVGLAPALGVSRDLRGAIAHGGRAAIDGGRVRARALLIGAEVALAVVLLAGAGLLVRSLDRLLGEELGFRTAGVVTADVALPRGAYRDSLRLVAYYDRLLPALRAIPGVEAVGVINAAPLSGDGGSSSFAADGGTEWVGSADYRVVDSAYFRAMGIPIRAGRGFGAGDVPGAEHAVVVNEAAARRFWPGASPLGHRVRFPGMDDHADLWLTIVGVVGDVRAEAPGSPPAPAMFVHMRQRPENLGAGGTLVVRAADAPSERLADAVRAAVRAADPNVPVRLSSLDALVARSVAGRRFTTTLLGAFAGIALALAALGIYGVLSYAVARRRREIGVRMALGAHRGTVRTMVLRDAMRAVVPGALVGVAGALAASRLLRGMLYDVRPADPTTFVAALAVLAAVALLAAWLPARRATRVDPLTAIRAE